MPYRVAHNGTGMTGREALQGIIDDPTLELVGLLTSSPDKAGTDAGEFCERPETGVKATGDLADILAAKPDCFCYCATAVRREQDAIDDIAGLLRAGIDVVTISTIPMVYAPAAPQAWREAIEEACAEGNSTFYATGSEPGVASLNIPLALLTGAGRVDNYRMDLYAIAIDKAYPVWDVLHHSMGFGKPDGHVPARIAAGKVDSDWGPVVRYIADVLGLRLDSVDLEWETLIAPTDLETQCGTIESGTISGHRWLLKGMVDGREAVGVQYVATVSSTPWPEQWPTRDGDAAIMYRVTGRPGLRLSFSVDSEPGDVNGSIPMTGLAAVNAIPRVVQADPGILEPGVDRTTVTRRHA